jgi:hypothetical protein
MRRRPPLCSTVRLQVVSCVAKTLPPPTNNIQIFKSWFQICSMHLPWKKPRRKYYTHSSQDTLTKMMLEKHERAAESEVWRVTLTTAHCLIYLKQSPPLPSQTRSRKGGLIRKLRDKVKKRASAPVDAQNPTTTNPSPSVQDPINNHPNYVSAVLTLGMPGVQ